MEPNQPTGPDPSRRAPEGGGPGQPSGGYPGAQYGPPPGYGDSPGSPYGPPSGGQYGPPPGAQYGPPPGYGDPSRSQYGPPPSDQFGPPPGSQYGPPPGSDFGPPPPPFDAPPPGAPYGPPAAAGFVAPAPRARTGWIVLVAVVLELVLIAAFVNQWLAEKISKFQFRSGHRFLSDVAGSALTYNWRFAPRSGDHQHLWLSQILLILTVLVVSGLLIAAVVRGPVTFGRAFFGTWMAVIVATQVGAIVRGLVNDANSQPGASRFTNGVFGSLGPSAFTFVAGVGLGLVTALVVAIVAASTRRSPARAIDPALVPAGPLPGPDQGRPPAGESGGAPWQDHHYGPPARHAAPGSEGARPDDLGQTTQLPVFGRAGDTGPTPRGTDLDEPPSFGGTPTFPRNRTDPPARTEARTEAPSDATTQLPRVPDRDAPAGPPPSTSPPSTPPPSALTAQPPDNPPSGPPPPPRFESDHPTTQLPAMPAGDSPTTQFPRPPDDEDLITEHE